MTQTKTIKVKGNCYHFLHSDDKYILLLEDGVIYVIRKSENKMGWDVYAKKQAMDIVINNPKSEFCVLPCSLPQFADDINFWLCSVAMLISINRNPFAKAKMSKAHLYAFEDMVISHLVKSPEDYDQAMDQLDKVYRVNGKIALIFPDDTMLVFDEQTGDVTNFFKVQHIDY